MSKKRTAAFGATVLSALVAGGVAFTPIATAEAEDSAFALNATGLLNVSKVPHVVGEGKDHLVYTELPPGDQAVLEAGVFNSAVREGFATSSVADVAVSLPVPGAPDIEASLIEAECDSLKGSTSLASLKVGNKEIELDQIKPNTKVVPGPLEGIASLTLNKQEKNEDGSLTVTAVSLDVLSSTQTLDLASATCTDGGDGPTEPTEPTEPGEPTEPTDPTEPTKPDDDGGDDDDDRDVPGDTPDEGGKAPKPVPQPGHLDVTG